MKLAKTGNSVAPAEAGAQERMIIFKNRLKPGSRLSPGRRILAGMTVLALFPIFAFAEPEISAQVNTSEISLDGSVTLSLQVQGINNVEAPQLNVPDFQVQSAGRTQSFQWINGQTSSNITFSFILSPTRAGALVIPAISLQSGGKTYSTQPITIHVAESGSAPPAAGGAAPSNENVSVPTEGLRPVFMTATVDKSKVYVGQQILLKVQFLRRPNVSLAAQPRYNEPDMTGFVVEPLKQEEFTTGINGVQYVVTELRYALFPTSDGEFAIGNARIDLAVRTPGDPFDPNTLFQNFFGQSQAVKLDTRAIPIQVRALPKNKPDHFSGAVGRYKMTAKVDAASLEVGKPFNLIVNIEGVGNVKSLGEPSIPDMKSFRHYETISTAKVNNEGKFIFGSKEFRTPLLPLVSGPTTISPISYVYFNPEEHEFVTEKTPEISLVIKPGTISPENMPAQAGGLNENTSGEGIQVVERDIRYLKSDLPSPLKAPMHRQTAFFVLNFMPPLFAFAAALTGWQTKRRTTHAAHYRSRGALRTASKTLKKAQRNKKGDPALFYGTVHEAVANFLADKLALSASGLVWEEVDRKLSEQGASTELRQELRNVFDEADMARFATSAFDSENKEASLTRAKSVLEELNKLL